MGKIRKLYLIFSAFELGFGDTVMDLDLTKIVQYYSDNVTSLGKFLMLYKNPSLKKKESNNNIHSR